MKRRLPCLVLLLAVVSVSQGQGVPRASELQPSRLPVRPPELWYDRPARLWVEALPVGNGRLGAMVFGGIATERVQFNESTLWAGEPHTYDHEGASEVLDTLRALLFAGKQKTADSLASARVMSIPLAQKAYQAFGDLRLAFPGIDTGAVTGYRRALDLDRAVTTTG